MPLRYKPLSALSALRPLRSLPNLSSINLLQPLRASQRLLTTTAIMSESEIKRNPHPDFKSVEASRPAWDRNAELTFTQTAAPDWKYGGGANGLADPSDVETKKHIAIDPHGEGRLPAQNYKLLISSIVPRPIAFVSTIGKDGKTVNLAPYSYFQVIGHDPPLFVVSFVTSLEAASSAKHTLHNLHETGECTINIVSEHFIEAANSTSINAPYGVSEWTISGLTPGYDTETVKAPRVKEAIFSIEGKLESVREFESKSRPGKKNVTLAVIEGTRFWVREDAINEERSLIDANVLRPACRLGGITYARLVDGYELTRPDFDKDLGIEAYKKLEAEKEGKI